MRQRLSTIVSSLAAPWAPGVARWLLRIAAQVQRRVSAEPPRHQPGRPLAGTTTPLQAEQDPLRWPPGSFVQPDPTTCGSAVLVMARMINHPDYARAITTATGPLQHLITEADSAAERFQAAALGMHRSSNRLWPRFWGTFPRALARLMSRECGVPGHTYRTRLVDPLRADSAFDAVAAAVAAGHVVPIYSFGLLEPRSGAHITLAVRVADSDLVVYEPSSGALRTASRTDFTSRAPSPALGWSTPLAVILPEAHSTARK